MKYIESVKEKLRLHSNTLDTLYAIKNNIVYNPYIIQANCCPPMYITSSLLGWSGSYCLTEDTLVFSSKTKAGIVVKEIDVDCKVVEIPDILYNRLEDSIRHYEKEFDKVTKILEALE